MSKNKPTATQMPVEAPSGEWVDVKHGMIPAIGVIPHPDQETYPGVIVREDNPEIVVVWHNRGCTRNSPKPDKVEFDSSGAPWCPSCFKENVFKDPCWTEIWKVIPGFSKHEISTMGGLRQKDSQRVLKPYEDPDTHYKKTSLKNDEGKIKSIRIHELVAITYLGEKPDGLEVCHGSLGSSDNRVTNLRYDTHQNNQLDQIKDGTHYQARKTQCDSGHEFTPENTRIRSDNGGRRCLQCETDQRVERLARMREHASRGEFRDPAVKLDTVADAVARFQAEEAARAKDIEASQKINPPTVFE